MICETCLNSVSLAIASLSFITDDDCDGYPLWRLLTARVGNRRSAYKGDIWTNKTITIKPSDSVYTLVGFTVFVRNSDCIRKKWKVGIHTLLGA